MSLDGMLFAIGALLGPSEFKSLVDQGGQIDPFI